MNYNQSQKTNINCNALYNEKAFLVEQRCWVMNIYEEEFSTIDNITIASAKGSNWYYNIRSNLHFPKANFINVFGFVTLLVLSFGIYTNFTYKTTDNPLIDTVSASSINADFQNVDNLISQNSVNCASLVKARLIRICDSMVQNIKNSKNLSQVEKASMIQKINIIRNQIVETSEISYTQSENILNKFKNDLSLLSLNLK